MHPSDEEDNEYKLHLMSLRREFLRPQVRLSRLSLELNLIIRQNHAGLPVKPELINYDPRLKIEVQRLPEVIIRHKARQKMCSRPSCKLIQYSEVKHQTFFRIPWAQIPKNRDKFYSAIMNNNPTISPTDILFLQYYPYIPLHRIEKMQFLDKQLHASFHEETNPSKEVQRLYYVNRVDRKPTFIDLPI